MIVAIMQPYFFPYIGYFQLMHAVDTFVFYDDVQYINRGWVNRNRIPLNNGPTWLTLPVAKASRELPINRRKYLLGEGVPAVKRKLRAAYQTQTQPDMLDFIEDLLDFDDPNVARFNEHLLQKTASVLDIKCQFLRSSELPTTDGLRGQDRIINICKQLGAQSYINPIGGLNLYDSNAFRSEGLELNFIKYIQTRNTYYAESTMFSIIDTLLQASAEEIDKELINYNIISPT